MNPFNRWNHRYHQHKANAAKRGIPFELSFEQWATLWLPFCDATGRPLGPYCMARLHDRGAYTPGNVRITTHNDNHAEAEHIRKLAFEIAARTLRSEHPHFLCSRREIANLAYAILRKLRTATSTSDPFGTERTDPKP